MLRPLGSFEHCFWLVNRGVASHIVFAAEIDGVATAPKWRAAFDALQRRHPLLHVRVPASPLGLPYFEAVHDRPIPLRHASDAIWNLGRIAHEWLDRALSEELSEPIDTDTAPLMRAVIATGAERSVIILSCSHVVCDGISMSYCLRDLLQALNGEALTSLPMAPSLNQLYGEAKEALHKYRPRRLPKTTTAATM